MDNIAVWKIEICYPQILRKRWIMILVLIEYQYNGIAIIIHIFSPVMLQQFLHLG